MKTYYIAQGTLRSALWWLKLGRKPKTEGMYVYLFHFAVQQKLYNIVKQLYANKN